MTYEQAVQNQWSIAYHRMKVAEENTKQGKRGSCRCEDCREHLAAIEQGPQSAGETTKS